MTLAKAPDIIRGVSQSHFSIARYSGAVKFMDHTYYWSPVDDELIRDDVLAGRKEWRVIREREDRHGDEWLGEPHKTRAKALKVAKADRTGRLVCLFGPHGIDKTTFMVDGEDKR